MAILFSGGGSGGHLFPAIATIQALESRGYKCTLITDNICNKIVQTRADIDYKILSIKKSNSSVFLYSLVVNIVQAYFLIKKHKASIIISFGGYSTTPILIAGLVCKAPIILHESNAEMGTVNKLFLPFAKKIAFFFPSLRARTKQKHQSKMSLTGTPVTKDILYTPYPEIKDKINILIVGGSNGASVFSKIIPKAISVIARNINQKIIVSHQCHKKDVGENKDKYTRFKIDADISSFFNNIAKKISEAHIIICRAGGSTIAEILNIGRVGVYIPYPYAKLDHQAKNAQFIADNGAGILINQKDLTEQKLANTLIDYIKHNHKLIVISKKTQEITIPFAANNLANLIEDTMNTENGGSGKI